MGREIRRVPADWEHPKANLTRFNHRSELSFQPMRDQPFEEAAREWLDKAIAWDNGTDPDCAKHKADHPFYWQWSSNPPDPDYYRPKWASEPTHYQVYETVSEGTPVTPHFETKAELIEYLVKHGDAWDQKRVQEGKQAVAGWDRQNAEEFVTREWAPTGIVSNEGFKAPRDGGL